MESSKTNIIKSEQATPGIDSHHYKYIPNLNAIVPFYDYKCVCDVMQMFPIENW